LKIRVSAVRSRPRPPNFKPLISNDQGLFSCSIGRGCSFCSALMDAPTKSTAAEDKADATCRGNRPFRLFVGLWS
jgi:hypothetical protein